MEALRKLEDVQIMLSFMQARGLLSSHRDSDRFLADLMLLLVQPYGRLNMDKKCHLISEFLSKISVTVLEEALLSLTGEGYKRNFGGYPIHLYFDNKEELQTGAENVAMIGLDAMQRANSTLEDFCRSYFMFHEMDVNKPNLVFRYLPVLSFTESYIYQLDSFNEEILNLSKDGVTTLERGPNKTQEKYRKLTDNFAKVFKDPFGPLLFQLEQHGILTERIREELRSGEEYWDLERKLCHALVNKSEILLEDVMRAIHLKSFDYRVLNLLLYQLRGKQVNDLHMEFLSISELLVEVSDDLFDYEDDVLENNFNILRMFVGIYGASTAPIMLAQQITDVEVKYERLLKTLDPDIALNYQRRCEEATREGGRTAGHSMGTWTIPPVIADEESYRSNLLKT